MNLKFPCVFRTSYFQLLVLQLVPSDHCSLATLQSLDEFDRIRYVRYCTLYFMHMTAHIDLCR